MQPFQIEGVIAVFMSLTIPLAAIVFACWTLVSKNNNDKEIRRLIIENNMDAERAKLLISETGKKNRKYGSLRHGLILIGMGLGALACFLTGVDYHDIYFWLILAVGIGIGMLVSFFVEMKLAEKGQYGKED